MILLRLIFLFNALTDFKGYCVYTVPLHIQLLLSFIIMIRGGREVFPFILMGIFLIFFYIYDSEEEYMGRGDYPIFLSLSMVHGSLVRYDLIFTSFTALLFSWILRRKKIPLVPFLFMGSLITDIFIFLCKFSETVH